MGGIICNLFVACQENVSEAIEKLAGLSEMSFGNKLQSAIYNGAQDEVERTD
jgi:hypothetical protein